MTTLALGRIMAVVRFGTRQPTAEEVQMLFDYDVEKAKDRSKIVKRFIKELDLAVTYTHRHYIADHEYIPFGEDIEAFLTREIAKPIIRWQDAPQLGYEILPNKVFYRYEPPKPAEAVLEEFWKLEREAEAMLEGLR